MPLWSQLRRKRKAWLSKYNSCLPNNHKQGINWLLRQEIGCHLAPILYLVCSQLQFTYSWICTGKKNLDRVISLKMIQFLTKQNFQILCLIFMLKLDEPFRNHEIFIISFFQSLIFGFLDKIFILAVFGWYFAPWILILTLARNILIS